MAVNIEANPTSSREKLFNSRKKVNQVLETIARGSVDTKSKKEQRRTAECAAADFAQVNNGITNPEVIWSTHQEAADRQNTVLITLHNDIGTPELNKLLGLPQEGSNFGTVIPYAGITQHERQPDTQRYAALEIKSNRDRDIFVYKKQPQAKSNA